MAVGRHMSWIFKMLSDCRFKSSLQLGDN